MIVSRSGFREVAAFREKDGIFEADKKKGKIVQISCYFIV